MKLSDVTFCDSLWSKFRGQMFRKSASRLVFRFSREEWVPLHMWFVFFSIDVVFLDSSSRIVEIKRDLRPFRFYSPKNRAKYVVELPVGSMGDVEIGSEIIFS